MTSAQNMELRKLIKTARTDRQAFGRLYDHYARDVYRYCFSRVGNQADAEDLTAQTFIAALESLSKYQERGKFNAWLFTIAHHQVAEHFRKKEHQVPLESIDLADPGESLLTGVIHSERAQLAANLIQDLEPREQELLRLRYLADLSFPEIGQILELKAGTVKKALYRLRDRLRTLVEIRTGLE